MPTCAFLTTSDLAGYVTDDVLAEAPLAELGWAVEHVPWRRSGGWERYEAVVIRSTWDYHKQPGEFLARVDLARLDSGAYALMELELIEPALYFRTDPESPRRFAQAFEEWMRRLS